MLLGQNLIIIMHEFSRQKKKLLANYGAISICSNTQCMNLVCLHYNFFVKRAISMCMHMCDSVVINCYIIQGEIYFGIIDQRRCTYICDFVDSHHRRIPNEGGVSASIAKPELTEGAHIDVMTNIAPIYYKLLLTILLTLQQLFYNHLHWIWKK